MLWMRVVGAAVDLTASCTVSEMFDVEGKQVELDFFHVLFRDFLKLFTT